MLAEAARLHLAGSLAEAEGLYRQVLAVDPHNADVLHLLGVVAQLSGRPSAAAALMRQAIRIQPRRAAHYSLLGTALAELGRFEDALKAHQTAVQLEPNSGPVWTCAAETFNAIDLFDRALVAADRAIRCGGASAETHYNRGLALDGLGRAGEAVAAYEAALRLRPDYAEARCNLGAALFDRGRIDEALEAYDSALRLKPDLAGAHLNKAFSLLQRGDWTAAWTEYEWRWRAEPKHRQRRDFPRPQWTGEPVAGRTVLLHAEQGLGDTLQFCRYADMVSAQGARVVLEVPRTLVRLLSGLKGVDQLVPEGAPLPAFDVHCPLMSLPGVFRTEPQTIPAAAAAYLAVDPAAAQAWSGRLGPPARPRIGLVWSGRPDHRYDRHRSLPLARLRAALPPGFDYVSLQREVRPADQAALAALPDVRHFGPELKDFADTAALVAQMDVVVSVDTSVAHLAGALGKDVRLLLSRIGQDWRWLTGRSDTPWYPTMRLYRQGEDQDWGGPLQAVARDLAGA